MPSSGAARAAAAGVDAAIQRFSQTLAGTYVRLATGRPVPTDLSDDRLLAIEESWAALVQKTPTWGLGLQHMAQVVDKLPGMKGMYDAQALPSNMGILDMNGDGLMDYLEYKAYMVTVWSSSLELNSGSGTAPAEPADTSRGSRRRKRRSRRGGDVVSRCPDLLLVGKRRLSEIFFTHLQLVTSEFVAAQKAGTAKGRNPFKSLPNYDPTLSTYIRSKSLALARKVSFQCSTSELTQRIRSKLVAMDSVRAKLAEESAAAERISSLAGNADDSDGDGEGDGDDRPDEEAEARRRRQQQLLKEEAAMMRKALHDAHLHPQTEQGEGSTHGGGSPARLRQPQPPTQQPAQPQAAGFSGMFRKLGAFFGKAPGVPEAPSPPPISPKASIDSPLVGSSRPSPHRSEQGQVLPPVSPRPPSTAAQRTPSTSVPSIPDASGQVPTQYDRHILRYSNSDLAFHQRSDSSGGYASDSAATPGPSPAGPPPTGPRTTRRRSLHDTTTMASTGSIGLSGGSASGIPSPLRHGSAVGGEFMEMPSRFAPTPSPSDGDSGDAPLPSPHAAAPARRERSPLQISVANAILADAGVALTSLSADEERPGIGSSPFSTPSAGFTKASSPSNANGSAETSHSQISLPQLHIHQAPSGTVTPRSGDSGSLPLLKMQHSLGLGPGPARVK